MESNLRRKSMIFNYLKLLFRNIKRNKGYSVINISGLVVAMTCFLLIMLYVQYELNYDNFHKNGERIYRVVCQLPGEKYGMSDDVLAITPAPLAESVMESFPEVEAATRFSIFERVLLSRDDSHFFERGIFADHNFLNIFDFKLIQGNIETLFDSPQNIVLCQSLANKLFGKIDPIGKTITCFLGDFTVVAIAEDVPENSHIQFDWMMPFGSQFRPADRDRRLNMWNWDDYYSYLKMSPGFDINLFEEKLNNLTKSMYIDWEVRTHFRYFLQSLDQVHLTSGYRYELGVTTDISLIRLFSAVAFFILLIACINAINLATANVSKRAKEVGIKKVVGSSRYHLFWQFTSESLIISFLSLILAAVLVDFLLPEFNQLVDRSLDVNTILSISGIIGLSIIILLTGLISGIYPSFILSSLKPVRILSRQIGVSSTGINLRNLLVLFQFSIAIVLMIASIIIFRQLGYIKDKDLGFNRNQILVLNRADPGIRENFSRFTHQLRQNPNIIDITTSSQLPTNILSATGREFQTDKGEEKSIHYQHIGVDYNFIDLFQMDIVQGRNFSRLYRTDSTRGLIVNESFVKQMGWIDPIGKQVPQVWNGPEDAKLNIVGVVKDFHARSLHLEIKPVIMTCRPKSFWIYIQLQPETVNETLAEIEKLYTILHTRYPFDYFFLDDQFNRMYQSEQKLARIIIFSNMLAIFLACLGIFGLAIYAAERRTKEIGIRKVLGASVIKIVSLLSWNFTKWVLLANAIAWPIGYLIMTNWLENFTYRINIEWWIFIIAGLLTLLIAMMTIIYHSVKTAIVNPAQSLRYE